MPEESKKDEGKIVLETKMYSDACRIKVFKAINSQPGVEDLHIDLTNNKVTLKAPNVDAKKLFEAAKKKSGGKITKLLHPDPNKKKTPVEVTVVLKVNIDCTSCKNKVEKAAWKLKGVHSVKVMDQILTLKGWDLDPKEVCAEVIKRSRKHAVIVPPKKEDGNLNVVTQYVYPPQYFSVENPNVVTQYVSVYPPQYFSVENPNVVTQYVSAYPPQYFSDENPNACVLM